MYVPGSDSGRVRGGRILLRVGAVCLFLATACKTGANLATDYAQTARENYELAVGEFADRGWAEAISYADFIRIRFPFSRYAVEAELLIARAEFEQGNYITAMDAFKQFTKLHPTHKHTRNGWASFMSAASAYMNAPTSFFLLPPHYQRDQQGLDDALVELQYYFDHYSGSPTEEDAKKLQEEVQRRLLEHELYVARYYLDRSRPEAAIGRLEAAHKRYPGIGMDAEVLFLLGVTYLRVEEIELARATFTELQVQHTRHHHGKQARIYLKYIYDTFGGADPARPRPDRSPPTPPSPPRPKNENDPAHPEKVSTPPPSTSPPKQPKPAPEPAKQAPASTPT